MSERNWRWGILVTAAYTVWAAVLVAQGPAGSAGAPAGSAAQQTAPAPSAPRRDPFRPIVVKTAEESPVCTQAGKAGLIIGQLAVQGIVRGLNGEWIAVVDNNTNRAYFLRERDELCNGSVTRITAESVVMEERVRDASGQTRSREVVKRLSAD